MNITEIPRKYMLGFIIVAVIVLVTTVAINPGSFVFQDNTDYEAQKKLAEQDAKQYEALLASIEPNYVASQQLLEKIATEDVVRQDVEETLQTNQRLVTPVIANAEINLSARDDLPTAVNYINKAGSMIDNYNATIQPKLGTVFSDHTDTSAVASARIETQKLIENLRDLPVPQSAVELHKAELASYQKYFEFLDTASAYANGTDTDPWPDVYGQYLVIDNRLDLAKTEFNKLEQKYAYDFSSQVDGSGLAFVKTAQAQWTVTDIWNAAWQGIKVGLAKSFAAFSIKMLDKLVAHIEKSFAIASQLYYSNDLGRYYSVEYMKKFVADPIDQDIIQKFLPQYFCVNPTQKELKQIFTAKAAANQGTDIVIDPSDPDYLNKLARLGGDEKNYPQWWEGYYTALANQTRAEAEAAATKEVLSPGLKSGRDIISGQINKTMSSIFNVQEAAISNTIGLGTNNADSPVSQIVAGVVSGLVNKFIFTPIGGGSGGGIGVIAEQNVCLKVPKLKPIVALPDSQQTPTSSELPPVTGTNPPGSTPR
jgi:hypothetical protein